MSSIPLWLTAVQRAAAHPENTLYLSENTIYAGLVASRIKVIMEQQAVDSIIQYYSQGHEPISDEIKEKMKVLSPLIAKVESDRPLVQLFNFFIPSQVATTKAPHNIADDFKYNPLTRCYHRILPKNTRRLDYGSVREEEIDLNRNTYKIVYGNHSNTLTLPIAEAPEDISAVVSFLRQKKDQSPPSS